jgi:hypothetical protein
MGSHAAEHSAVIAAAPEACFDALCALDTVVVDPGRFVPSPVRRLVAEHGTRMVVEDLRARVERPGPG